MTSVFTVYRESVQAIRDGVLIRKVSSTDKEYHFQNWFERRLKTTKINYERVGRNRYPDFRIVSITEGYELKGLAYPGRDASFDSNSQVPTGFHNGRTIFYVFGRYPKVPAGSTYPVLDLVMCHGDFLNADHTYVHENKSVKGFGSYGDIMIRDRKMYVVPTPFKLLNGVNHLQTLILPREFEPPDSDFVKVGEFQRVEADELIIGYTFDLLNNTLTPQTIPNPSAGRVHPFSAWRIKDSPATAVTMNTTTGSAFDEPEEEMENSE